ncbi:hypothetical protein CLV79_11833 [Limimaricola soesokkakensis]|uniref:Uncharacterized protein n=2 Tax=Limimaricola soesokkakensis TaxID=1343159 RepID=A0A1X7A581_9RHOB|nr:hypothetical protein [Limimaricola soesokkakensis]PSK81002.1 hypothetical protein CLV79_11833 [Limimaricola soesokkakensis]SLN68928.1 hypothetical protein LOS8367_03457 [Limimaricola soesokkakensis]
MRIPFCAALAVAVAGPVAAGEMWVSDLGALAYETDEGDTAILSFPTEDAAQGRLYIPGLAGNWKQRGVHEAYWIAEGEGLCGATLTGPDGIGSTMWGRAVVAFDKPEFPTGFTVTLGDCMSTPFRALRADLDQ